MIPTLLIGDLHADLDAYRAALNEHRGLPSIQVGDFGIGRLSGGEAAETERLHRASRRHRFIRGNHDQPSLLAKAPGWIADGTISGEVLFLGGADPGESTQITPAAMEGLLEHLRIQATKPSVVISHDAPQAVAEQVAAHVHRLALGSGRVAAAPVLRPSRTRTFLSAVQEIVEPKLWIFGHWHEAWEGCDGATFFRCMAFQENFVLPLPWDPDWCSPVRFGCLKC